MNYLQCAPMNDLRIGVAQIRSTNDPWENLALVSAFVEEAAAHKLDLLCFPENLFYRGPKTGITDDIVFRVRQGRMEPHSDFSREVDEIVSKASFALSFGSVLERNPLDDRPFNAHWFVQKNGVISSYHKIHLFDFQGTNAVYKESAEMSRGSEVKTAPLEGHEVGLSICYDLRFPELYRKLTVEKKATLLLVPAAFTRETGRAHWHSLLKSRAIENLSFVAAAGQWGSHKNAEGQDLFCYGHSLIIAPWGEILAEGPEEGDALLTAVLRMEELKKARARLPVFESIQLLKGVV